MGGANAWQGLVRGHGMRVGEMATEAGGVHATGMHFLLLFCPKRIIMFHCEGKLKAKVMMFTD